nr:H112 [uncultured bacterium]
MRWMSTVLSSQREMRKPRGAQHRQQCVLTLSSAFAQA